MKGVDTVTFDDERVARLPQRRSLSSRLPVWIRWMVLLWALPFLLTTLVWLVGIPLAKYVNFYGDSSRWSRAVWYEFVRREFFPGWNIFSHGAVAFWVLFGIWMILTAVGSLVVNGRYGLVLGSPPSVSTGRKIAFSIGVFGMVYALVLSVITIWDNDKDQARFYNASVQFVVRDPHHTPVQLNKLVNNAKQGSDVCALKGSADVPSCITAGSMPTNWVARNASAEAAANKLAKSSTGSSNTYVMTNSLTYLYQQGGLWSAVRDGKNRQSLDAVVEWDGSGSTTECRFTGQYAITGAFRGRWTNNLQNTLAKRYPTLFYNLDDVWGYCNGNEPVVILPVTRQVIYAHRTVMTAGGVLVIRGNHGKANITHLNNPKQGDDLKAGKLPGPSYPVSLTEQARDLSKWAAGRANKSRSYFGFEPTDATSQYGNASEYLLRNAKTGELDWVTPLTPRGSDSQQFVAWAVTPAGFTHAGKLNTTRIYVLEANDSQIVNLYDLTARAKQALSATNPGFFSAGGKIVEFLPVSTTVWQAYGELGNRVVYRLDIPTSSQAQTFVFDLSNSTSLGTLVKGPSTNPVGGGSVCGQDPSTLTPAQLASCIGQLATELNKRETATSSQGMK